MWYMYIYIYTHTHTHIYIYIYIYTHTHIYIHTHTHTQWNISHKKRMKTVAEDMEKNEHLYNILPFAIIWMDLEGIMLSEISQTKINTVWFYLDVESKK